MEKENRKWKIEFSKEAIENQKPNRSKLRGMLDQNS